MLNETEKKLMFVLENREEKIFLASEVNCRVIGAKKRA